MLFSVLFAISVSFFLLFLLFAFTIAADSDMAAPAFMMFLVSGFLAMPNFVVWSDHADNLGTIQAQSEVISVYQTRVTALTARLDTFEYPKGSAFNADTPIAAIVASLTAAETELVKARAAEANAKVRVEQRRVGPMSHVIWFAGDYK